MNKKGFSIIEVMVVLALLALIFGASIFYYRDSLVRTDINTQAELMANTLRLLRSNAASGNVEEPNSIRLEESEYVKFFGSIYNPEDPDNITKELPEQIKIDNINLNGGGQEIIFSAPHGTTTNFGSFDVKAEQIDRSITININRIGSIDF